MRLKIVVLRRYRPNVATRRMTQKMGRMIIAIGRMKGVRR